MKEEMGCKFLIIDSGAVQVYHDKSKKIEIDIDDYIDYIKQNREWVDGFETLDVMEFDDKGKWTKNSIKQTIDNWKYMESNNTLPIPIIRANILSDVYSQVSFYLKNGQNFISMSLGSKLNKYKNVKLITILLKMFPSVRLHGLAATDIKIMRKVPFYSVDSTSWIKGTIYAGYNPHRGDRHFQKNILYTNIRNIKDFPTHKDWTNRSETGENRQRLMVKGILDELKKYRLLDKCYYENGKCLV